MAVAGKTPVEALIELHGHIRGTGDERLGGRLGSLVGRRNLRIAVRLGRIPIVGQIVILLTDIGSDERIV